MDLTGLIFAALASATKANKRIDTLPLPMVFKGTLGTGGTIETLPTASSDNEGFVYIVITNGTYEGQTAKAGDLFISDGSSWVLVPSADDNSVIDDSVISTALTWSSNKINDECKMKTFTYKGNGSTTNVINFPTKPNIILSIQREYDASNDHRTASPIIWGWNTNLILFQRSSGNPFGTTSYTDALTFDDVNKTMTIVTSGAPSSLNSSDKDFKVCYI